MSSILVAGFTPFTLITKCTGNPSQKVALALGEMYGHRADVAIMDANESCLQVLDSKLNKNPSGILMFGGTMQVHDSVLEMEGVETSHHGWLTKCKTASSFAKNSKDYCISMGLELHRLQHLYIGV